jgi:protein-L-isoaspartate(D-aspartate) O-methyltransferase
MRFSFMADYAKQRVTMVDTQVRPSDVTKFPIIDAMLDVPREAFVPDARREMAYVGGPIEIAPGRVLLEARTIAKMLDAADLEPGDVVLEVGWAWATARRCWRISWTPWSRSSRTKPRRGGGSDAVPIRDRQCRGRDRPACDGYAKAGPYDAILIFGGIEDLPDGAADQLRTADGSSPSS